MPLTALDLPPGLNSDDTTLAAEGRWADGDNVRFVNGKPQAIGYMAAGAFTSTAPAIRAAKNWTTSAGSEFTAYGTNGAVGLYVRNVGLATQHDITPSPAPSASIWSFDLWGDYLIAHPGSGTLYVWQNNTGARASEITQAPNTISAMLVTPQRQILALGCNEEASGTFNSRCIRGCDIENYTDWTTSVSNNAFEHILEGEPGHIVTARMLGDYVAIWTTTSVWLGIFLGDPERTYRFQRIASGCGMWNPSATIGERHAVCVVGQTAYWLGADLNFYAWTLGSLPAKMPCPIGDDFRRNVGRSQAGANFCCHLAKFSEVWWFYDDARDTSTIEPTRYVALNISDGTWFRGQLSRTYMIDASGTIDLPRAFDHNGDEIYHEHPTGGASFSWYIQSADQSFMKGNRRVLVRGVQPDFENQSGDVSLTLSVRDRPHASATTKGPYTLTTATTKKDFRASGKLISVKFSGSGTASHMRLGTPLFDIVPMGER